MSKAHEYKFLYIISVSLLLFLSSCVDTSVQNLEPSYDFHSLFKITNIASGSNVTSVTVINNSTNVTEGEFPITLGSENPAEGQAFMDIQSGSKRFILHGTGGVEGQLFIQTLDTERKYRLYIFSSDTVGGVSLLKANLRYTWQQKGTDKGKTLFYPDSAFVGFTNCQTDSSISKIEILGTDTTVVDLSGGPLGIGQSTPVMLHAPDNYTVNLYSADDSGEYLLTSFALAVAGAGRYAAVVYGQHTQFLTKVFTDD